jgi:hypothetical protein
VVVKVSPFMLPYYSGQTRVTEADEEAKLLDALATR